MRRGNPTQVRILWPAPFIEAWDISRPLALGARAGLGSTGRLDHYWAVAQSARAQIKNAPVTQLDRVTVS